jgi:hypothetical protein
VLAGLLLGSAAAAQDVQVAPLADARLRYEQVDQDGFARGADALTRRLRPGIQLTTGHWSVLVEGEATLAIVEDYSAPPTPSPFEGRGIAYELEHPTRSPRAKSRGPFERSREP